MSKIKFENGTVVNFDGEPNQQDIEEISRKVFSSTLTGTPSYQEKQANRPPKQSPIQVEPEDIGGAVGAGLGAFGGVGGTVFGSTIGQGLGKFVDVASKKWSQSESIQQTENPITWGDVAYETEQAAKRGFVFGAAGEAVAPIIAPMAKVAVKPAKLLYKRLFNAGTSAVPELPELLKMADDAYRLAMDTGDTKKAEYMLDVAKRIKAEINLNKYGGNLTRAQLTQIPKDIKAEKFARDSSYGQDLLIKTADIDNPKAIKLMGEKVNKSVLASGEAQRPEIMGKLSARPVQETVDKLNKISTTQKEKIVKSVEARLSQASDDVLKDIDSIRVNAGNLIGENIPVHPLSQTVDAKARRQIFESKYKPLMEEAKSANAKVNVESAKIAAGIPAEAAQSKPVSANAMKLYNDSVAAGTPEETLAILREQLGIESVSTSEMENAIAEGANATFTTDIAKRIVQKIPQVEGGIDFEMANTVKTALGRAAAKARSQGARDAARIIENAKLSLVSEMDKTANMISPDFGARLKQVDAAYGQAMVFDELRDAISANLKTNPVTEKTIFSNGGKFAKYLNENAQDLERSGLSTDFIKNLAQKARNANAIESVVGNELDDMLKMAKGRPERFRQLFPDINPSALNEIQIKNQKIKMFSKELGDVSKSLQENPKKAAIDLLSDTNTKQPNKIKLVYNIVGKNQKEQLQYRMVEEVLNKSGDLAENVNKIPDSNWEAAFGETSIKNDLLEIAEAIKLTTQKTPVGNPPRILYAAERSPIVLAVYSLLRRPDTASVMSGTTVEVAIAKLERKLGQWLAKPNARKLLLQAIKKGDVESVVTRLDKFVNTNAVKSMNTEDKWQKLYNNFVSKPAAGNILRVTNTENTVKGKLNVNRPVDEEWQPNPNDLRPDGSQKGTGFLGVLKRPDGKVSTEISMGVIINGKETEIPTLVPTLNKNEIDFLLSPELDLNKKLWQTPMGQRIVQKAVDHANKRISEGKSPFYQEGEPR